MPKLKEYDVPVSVRRTYVAEEELIVTVKAVDEDAARCAARDEAIDQCDIDKYDADHEEDDVWCGDPKLLGETDEDAPTPRCKLTPDMFTEAKVKGQL